MSKSDTADYEELRAKKIAEREKLFAELFEELKTEKENVQPPKEKIKKVNKKQQTSYWIYKRDDEDDEALPAKRYNTRERTKKPIIDTDTESDTSSTSQKKIAKKKNTTKKSEKKTGKQVLASEDDDSDFSLYGMRMNFKNYSNNHKYNTRSKKTEITE